MSNANRPNRKASDADIVRLNSLGRSLGTVAKKLGVHPTTITLRLQNLGIEPADTRRTFMEGILDSLSEAQEEWLSKQLGPHLSIKDYVQNLLVKDYIVHNS
jgi:hypothetical protein